MKSGFLYIVYSLLYALLLPFHMLNSVEVAGGIKLWYLPVACLAITGLFHLKELQRSFALRLYGGFVILTFTSILIGGSSLLMNCVNLLLMFLAMLPMISLDKKLFYKLTPFFFLGAIYYSFTHANWESVNWRFQGMYNDPNYLVTSLIVGIYLCVQAFSGGKIVIKVISVIAILYALYTIMVTQSRGGTIALLTFALFIAIKSYRSSKGWTIAVVVLLLVFSTSITVRYAQNIENIAMRFSGERAGDRSGAMSRFKEMDAGKEVIENHPWVLITGAGYGISGSAKNMLELPYRYNSTHRIHNTPFAVLFEQGVFAFFLLVAMVVLAMKNTWKKDWIKFGLLLAVGLQSMTIWLISYLPFWLCYVECIHSNPLRRRCHETIHSI